jgi:hypothetical protein
MENKKTKRFVKKKLKTVKNGAWHRFVGLWFFLNLPRKG